MEPGLQSAPHVLHILVGLHLDLRLSPLNAIVDITGNEVAEEKRIGSLGPVLRVDSNQETVYDIGLVEFNGSDEMPPAERKQAPLAAFLQGVGKRGAS